MLAIIIMKFGACELINMMFSKVLWSKLSETKSGKREHQACCKKHLHRQLIFHYFPFCRISMIYQSIRIPENPHYLNLLSGRGLELLPTNQIVLFFCSGLIYWTSHPEWGHTSSARILGDKTSTGTTPAEFAVYYYYRYFSGIGISCCFMPKQTYVNVILIVQWCRK